ncbi:hypothetical protein MCHIJ_07590 [Mycolicibacterium chitae]|uniref:FHA domain-containing protein n=1 Tax=Mycolicibacterium chitae TaxID=1792 RepID=A0A448ICQ4_MYCCI|nr:hypothetical protein [Mycolicibacterium chitae]MCV7104345.1 hypothetical protein [Mycolicibacterium chitae]BBZ01322.1 hypothetical protein MCHIJ_07590 [Mycolicibacterium chitae]VEG50161.1 FHA domain-containing protein [Mycolicibacterium chitae]
MNVTLGVFVDPAEARVALLDAAAPNATIDQLEIDLATEPLSAVVSTLTATASALTGAGHDLVGTTLCSSDADQATELVNALAEANLTNVAVVPIQEAATAAVRTLAGADPVATLVNDGQTVALSMVDATGATSQIAVETIAAGDADAAYRTLLQRLATEPGEATGVIVMGSLDDDGLPAEVIETSPVPLRFPDDSEFALARGAALAGVAQDQTRAGAALSVPQDATMAAPVVPQDPQTAATPLEHDTVVGQQLAYSQAGDEDAVDLTDPGAAYDDLYDEYDQPYGDDSADEAEPDIEVRRRQMLIGSSVGSLAVIGFATLAVSLAVTVQPTASQQAIRLQEDAVPGKAFPVAPGQGAQPDGPNWTMIEQLPPPGTTNEVRTFEMRMLSSTRDGATQAVQAAPAMVNVYKDGTVGLANAAAPALPNIPVPNLPAPPLNPGITPTFPSFADFATRLIPDFSVISMIELLNFLANLPQFIPFDAAVPSVLDRSLDDVGVLAVVPKDQGALFSTTSGTAANVIPPSLFDTGKTTLVRAQELPPGTGLIDTLPGATDAAETPKVLSEMLLDPDAATLEKAEPAPDKPVTDAAEEATAEEVTDPDGTIPSPESTTETTEPSADPDATTSADPDATTSPSPSPSTSPESSPEPSATTTSAPSPERTAPEPTPTEEPSVEVETPTPTPTQVPTQTQEPTQTQVPTRTVAPEPVAPEPVAPEPVVPEPQPEVTLPTVAPAPETAPAVTQAPVTQPPVERAPATVEVPAVTVPTTVEMPSFGGGSLGSEDE